MLAVTAAFLKSALLTSVLVCIEIEEAESGGEGNGHIYLWTLHVSPSLTVFPIATLPSQILPLSCSKPEAPASIYPRENCTGPHKGGRPE